MEPGSEDEQICEIEVKKMYLAIERRVSQMLQEVLRQVELYLTSLFDGYARDNTYQPPANVGITRASGEGRYGEMRRRRVLQRDGVAEASPGVHRQFAGRRQPRAVHILVARGAGP